MKGGGFTSLTTMLGFSLLQLDNARKIQDFANFSRIGLELSPYGAD